MGNHAESTHIHIPYAWSYADQTAREAASGFAAGDVGKLALQEDDNTLWILTATTPTWVSVSGSSAFTNGAAGIARLTADVTISATTPGTGITGLGDLTLAAVAGDYIMIGISGLVSNTTAQSMKFDVASIVSAAVVNYVSSLTSTAATNGISAFYVSNGVLCPVSGSILYVVQAGDVSGGNIVLRAICWVAASTRVLTATTPPFVFWAKNLGQ